MVLYFLYTATIFSHELHTYTHTREDLVIA